MLPSIIFRARIDDCANALLHIFNDGTCIVQLFDLLFFAEGLLMLLGVKLHYTLKLCIND